MAGFDSILQRSQYTAGFAGGEGEPAVTPVVPLRAEDVQGIQNVEVLGRFGDGETKSLAERMEGGKKPAGEDADDEPEVDIEALVAAAEERGRKQASEELADAIRGYEESKQKFESMAKTVDAQREAWAQQLRDDVGDLVLQTLERIVAEVPEVLDEHLLKGLAVASQQMISAQQVDIIVHPDDQALAEEVVGEREGWAVFTDDKIRGGCLVEAPSGKLDASLDSALEAISVAIAAWKEESRPSSASEE